MTFEKATPRVPTSIRSIRIELEEIPNHPVDDGKGSTTIYYRAEYFLEVLDQNGALMQVQHNAGDLIPHLTDTQKAGLLQFMADIRTKAEAELLP